MSPKIPLRIASLLMLFHAATHTIGALTMKNVQDEAALKVLNMMSEVKVPMFGKPSTSTYGDFFLGYGLSFTVVLLTLCALFWLLGDQAETNRGPVRVLLIPLFFAMIGFTVLDFMYFFPAPALTCLLTGVCTAAGLVLKPAGGKAR